MIAIVDCNSFYCSCERVFRPELRTKPVVVLSNNDGCIISRTDEAKASGIDMTAPFFMVKDLIDQHNVKAFSSNYSMYGDMSLRVMDILAMIAGKQNVEVYSIDEAFIDLKNVPLNDLQKLAVEIKTTVEMWTGIPVSIGIAKTKTLAKIANTISKKNKIETGCISVITTELEQQQVLQECKVKKIWGVGRANAQKLELQGIHTAWQLANVTEDWAHHHLGGVVGLRLIRELNGERSIFFQEELVTKKMITTSRMFGKPVYDKKEIKEAIATYISKAAEKLRRQKSAAGVLTIYTVAQNKKIKTEHFKHGDTLSAQCYLPIATNCTNVLIQAAMPLIDQFFIQGLLYKKAGVMLSNLVPDTVIQQNLFETADKSTGELMEMMDNINFSMRNNVVRFATAGTTQEWKMKQEYKSPRYTTCWEELCEVK